MSERRGWLVNNVSPASVKSNEFDVAAGVVRIVGANLGGNLPVQVYVGGDVGGIWVNLCRNGAPVVLNDLNNSYVEMVGGYYRIDATNAGPHAQVWLDESYSERGDDRTIYVYSNSITKTAGGGGGGTTGLTSVATAATCTVAPGGDGTTATPLSMNVKVSPNTANLLTQCDNGQGLVGLLHTNNTCSVTATGSGTESSPLTMNLNFIPASSGSSGNNIIDCAQNPCSDIGGLYLAGIGAPKGTSNLTVFDGTNTVNDAITSFTNTKTSITQYATVTITPTSTTVKPTVSWSSLLSTTGGTANGGLSCGIVSATVYAVDDSFKPLGVQVDFGADKATIEIPSTGKVNLNVILTYII